MIKGNFWVGSLSFYFYFESIIRPRNLALWPHKLSNAGFEDLMNNIRHLTGKSEITLSEFCGYFSIIYNETGGTFISQNEFGGASYMFGTNGGRKRSYNHLWDLKNQKCGEQLVAMGKMTRSASQYQAWNGTVYPGGEYASIANEWCDFNRYKGRGIIGITGRSNYQRTVDPIVGDTSRMSHSQLDSLFKQPKVYLGSFRNYVHNLDGGKAITQLADASNPSAFGYLIAGRGDSHYVQHTYMARYKALYQALEKQKITNSQFWLKEGKTIRKGVYYSILGTGLTSLAYLTWRKIRRNKQINT